jgi:protein-disulfide isomerase
MSTLIDKALSSVLCAAALLVGAGVVHREFFQPRQRPTPPPMGPPSYVSNWTDAIPVGLEIGEHSSPIKVIEFGDLECPFCKSFHEAVRDVMQDNPGKVSLVFVHFPSAAHRFAMQAARAAECADQKGRAAQLVNLVFTLQDSIGMKSWGSFAGEAGIGDTAAFRTCALDPTPLKRIEAGRALGDRLQISGTPTVIVNGWRFSRPPGKEELAEAVRTLLRGGKLGDTTSAIRASASQ